MSKIKNSILVSLNGVGWNVKINTIPNSKDKELVFQVGFSHPVKVSVPSYIEIVTRSETLLEIKVQDALIEDKATGSLSNSSKTKIGDFVAKLLRIRPWNIYTGQGIIRRDRTDHLVRRRGKRK